MDNKTSKSPFSVFTDFADNQHLGFSNVRRRCDSCNEWVEGNLKYCNHCWGYVSNRKKAEDTRKKEMIATVRKRRAEFELKPPFVKFMIRIGRSVEIAYLAFISGLTALMATLAG